MDIIILSKNKMYYNILQFYKATSNPTESCNARLVIILVLLTVIYVTGIKSFKYRASNNTLPDPTS